MRANTRAMLLSRYKSVNLVSSESEDEESSNPKRGHGRRQEDTIEAAMQDKDDITDEDLRGPFCRSPVATGQCQFVDAPTQDREISAVGFEPKRPQVEPPARMIAIR